jgi:hypothetical protein
MIKEKLQAGQRVVFSEAQETWRVFISFPWVHSSRVWRNHQLLGAFGSGARELDIDGSPGAVALTLVGL